MCGSGRCSTTTTVRRGHRELHPGVYVRSFYFSDPDGIVLEFACWTREFTDHEAATAPKTAADRKLPISAG